MGNANLGLDAREDDSELSSCWRQWQNMQSVLTGLKTGKTGKMGRAKLGLDARENDSELSSCWRQWQCMHLVLTGSRTGKRIGRADLGLDTREDDVGGRAVEAGLQQLRVTAQLGKLGAVQLGRAAAAAGALGSWPGAEAGKGRKRGLQVLLADLDGGQLGHLQSAITVKL